MEFKSSIWSSDDLQFETGTLLFQLFYLNPVSTGSEAHAEIRRVFDDLSRRLKPWRNHFVWDTAAVAIKLCEDAEHPFVYGELVFGESYEEEWLITSILFDLSKTYEDVYIHLSDNDGEFLLIEGFDHLPEWLSPENGRFRDWINHGRILIIPEEYYKDRGLKLKEALKFLDRAAYRCERITELDDTIKKKVNQQPNSALETQCWIELQVSRPYAGFLMTNNILHKVVLEYGKNEMVEEGNISIRDGNTSDSVIIRLRTTVICYLFIEFHLKGLGMSDIKVNGGKLVSNAISQYLKNNPVNLNYLPSDEEIEKFNAKGDVLQDELIRLMRIEKYVDSKLTFDDSTSAGNLDDDELITRLRSFFQDTDAGLDGVENSSVPKNAKNGDAKIETIDSDDDTTSSDDNDDDEKVREFLAKANVDIDEDDFFEYFAKEALKLTDDDLQAFRSMDLNDHGDEQSIEEVNAEDHESEFEELTQEDEETLQNLTSEDLEAMTQLLKLLKEDGGIGGPTSTFFQNI